MQDSYISLNPERAAHEERTIKKRLVDQRRLEAAGGMAGPIFGAQLGLSASFLYYSFMPKSFSLFPFSPKKFPRYGALVGSFAICYVAGIGFVKNLFGDDVSMTYLAMNKRGIVRGDKPWERARDTEE